MDQEDSKTTLFHLQKAFEQLQQEKELCISYLGRLSLFISRQDSKNDGLLSRLREILKKRGNLAEIDPILDQLLRFKEKQIQSKDSNFLPADIVIRCIQDMQIDKGRKLSLIQEVQSRAGSELGEILEVVKNEISLLMKDCNETLPLSGQLEANSAIISMLQKLMVYPRLQSSLSSILDRFFLLEGEKNGFLLAQEAAEAILLHLMQINREKAEISIFLSKISEKLDTFDNFIQDAKTDIQQSHQLSTEFHQTIRNQMQSIRKEISEQSDISDLKVKIEHSLAVLAEKMIELKNRDEKINSRSDERFGQLSLKMKELEQETQVWKDKYQQQLSLLMRDSLTKAYSRYAYDQFVKKGLEKWKSQKMSVIFSIWDIDFFKKINDTYGHKAGDLILQKVSGFISQMLPETAFFARVGGEEFVIIFENFEPDKASVLADQLRSKIERETIPFQQKQIKVTMSAGLTNFRSDDSFGSLYERADLALYKAKEKGRNICISDI